MIVRVPTIVVKLEGGVGRRTVPLLITEMTFEGEVRDWSGKVSFYNTGKQLQIIIFVKLSQNLIKSPIKFVLSHSFPLTSYGMCIRHGTDSGILQL